LSHPENQITKEFFNKSFANDFDWGRIG
jgi:hypothetical protein